jgi:hypothetical protein
MFRISINVNQWWKHPHYALEQAPSPGQSSIGGTLQNSAGSSGQTLLIRPSDSLTAFVGGLSRT